MIVRFYRAFHVEMENSFKALFTFTIINIARNSFPLLTIHWKLPFYELEVVLMAHFKVYWSMTIGHEFGLVAHIFEVEPQGLGLENIAFVFFIETFLCLWDPCYSKKESCPSCRGIGNIRPTIRTKPHFE